ncbi:MAG: outer membrane protein assembly factor [Flavobacteriales bacterium]|nr:outer membrane protein assembly factor [Flavobacteriales bacterium]
MNIPLQFALVLLFSVGMCWPALAQEEGPKGAIRRYFDNVLGDSGDPSAPKFINYPTLAFSPETNWEVGVSSLYVYSANRNVDNRLSELKAFTFYTLENQYGLWLDHALYTDENKWFFYGRARYQRFPLFFYGVGRDSPAEVQSVIDGEYMLFRERALRETLPSLYVGLELDFQRLSRVQYARTHSDPGQGVPSIGAEGSRNLGVGIGVLYDNIHNAMNPREGLYSEWAFLSYGSGTGSDFDFTSYISDSRVYLPVKENTVFAAQLYGQFTRGQAPFNMLSLMGGESLMRGYYLGRYRDKNLIAGQVEYRILPFSFSKRIGASVFMAAGQVYGEDRSFQWQQFLPTGGAGLRILIFPDKDIYTRIDVAFTSEGSGVYFHIGEAF